MTRILSNQVGASLLELMTATLISTTLIAAALGTFQTTSGALSDNEVIHGAEDSAQRVLELLSRELRLVGAGMPLGHANFKPGDAGLGDAPLPVLLNSGSDAITFRTSTTGKSAVLIESFAPEESLTLNVTSTTDLEAGDSVYLAGATAGSEDALKGRVSKVIGSSIVEIDPDYLSTSGVTFPAGSLLTRVKEVSYYSDPTILEVSRSEGSTSALLAENASFELSYLDSTGTSLQLPLSTSEVAETLSAIEISVKVKGARSLQNGKEYEAIALQRISLRNLSIARTE